jgi:hypothetical protein
VHSTSSSHAGGPGLQPACAVHTSAPLQNTPSSHCAWSGENAHDADTSLHPSSVHATESAHAGAGPPAHTPPLHASAVVQKRPSSQGSALAA